MSSCNRSVLIPGAQRFNHRSGIEPRILHESPLLMRMHSPSSRSLIVLLAISTWALNTAWGQSLRLEQTDESITIQRDGQTVLRYNIQSPPVPSGIDKIYRRSGFLHPVCSPRGVTVTETFPADHPHQHGIFSAWVRTVYDGEPIDFWNLAGGTGRVLHDRVVRTFEHENSIGFEADLLHRKQSDPPADVLRERWKITVPQTDSNHHLIDLQIRQSIIGDKPLTVSKYHYGGVALRGLTRWLVASEKSRGGSADSIRESSQFINDAGSDRIKGNLEHANWVALSGSVEGRPVTIAALCHPTNFRAPQAARLHPTKPYFCFAPCADGEFTIDSDHPYEAKYRFLITDELPDAAWLNDQWQLWCDE